MSQSFVFSPEWNGYRPSATGLAQKNCPFFVFTSVEGKGTPLPFEAPANHLASFFFPLPMSGDPRSLKCKHLRDPHVLLTVTFWLLDNFSSTGGGSIIPTSSSPWAITWHKYKPNTKPTNQHLKIGKILGYIVSINTIWPRILPVFKWFIYLFYTAFHFFFF